MIIRRGKEQDDIFGVELLNKYTGLLLENHYYSFTLCSPKLFHHQLLHYFSHRTRFPIKIILTSSLCGTWKLVFFFTHCDWLFSLSLSHPVFLIILLLIICKSSYADISMIFLRCNYITISNNQIIDDIFVNTSEYSREYDFNNIYLFPITYTIRYRIR